MASNKSNKGKRYTDKEKQKIIDFVNAHNAEKGRGGAATASRKFKVSQLTVGNWIKKAGDQPVAKRKTAKRKTAKRKTAKRGYRVARKASAPTSRSKKLAALNKVDRQIVAKRKELAALEAKFDGLIKSL
jgi:hypothetical protein